MNLYKDYVILRSRNKIEFQTPVTTLTKVMKSPYYRGVSLWDMLNEEVLGATTKVRFKETFLNFISAFSW